MTRILRLRPMLERTGYTRTPAYNAMAKRLLPSPVKIGPGRAVGWPEHEIEAVLAARIAGLPDAKIVDLVDRLHAARTAGAPK